jgi:hypothetical protein
VVLTAAHIDCKCLDLFVILTDEQSIKDCLCILQEAECEKSAMDVKYNTDTKIEDNARMYKLQKASFDKEVNTAVSIQDLTVSTCKLRTWS